MGVIGRRGAGQLALVNFLTKGFLLPRPPSELEPLYAKEAKERQRQSPGRPKKGQEKGKQKVAQVKREEQARDKAFKEHQHLVSNLHGKPWSLPCDLGDTMPSTRPRSGERIAWH